MINDHYNTLFTVYRMQEQVGDVWKQEMSQNGSFYGHKQRATSELTQNLGISFTKGYTIWCPVDSDVYEGDNLLDDEGNYYSVTAINPRNYGNNQHLQLVVEQDTKYASI